MQSFIYFCTKQIYFLMKLLSSPNYTIELGSILDSSFQDLLNNHYSGAKKIIIVDENTHDNCLEFLLTSFDTLKEAEVMLLPAGEENKVMEVCFQVWEALTEYQIGRNDLIINLGGGVVTDMGGFIASVFKRGVDFVHIPTSLVGMVDASIGGKNGVDLGSYKNQLGVFSHPKFIFIDPLFLATLPAEEWMNGYAEMLKHTLISDRKKYNSLKKISSGLDLKNLELISDSVHIKFDIVEADPLELGLRKILNFGHTIGHALEGFFLEIEPVSHGHAIALGMIAESYIAMQQGKLSKEDYFDIELTLLEKFSVPKLEDNYFQEIAELTRNDKKNRDSKILCSLVTEIGSCDFNCEITLEEIIESLKYISKFHK